MASSSRLTLVSPLRVWLVFNGLFIALVASSWYSNYRLAAADNQRIVQSQVLTLTKSRFDDLAHRRFRDFVEGIGREFNDLWIRVDMNGEVYKSGRLPANRHCADLTYPLGGADAADTVRVDMCRPFRFSNSAFLIVLAMFVLISGVALAAAQALERRTTSSLIDFLRTSGVQVSADRGLVGIMGDMRDIRNQLDHAKEQERAFIDAKVREELAAQVAHDIRSPLAALDSIADGVARLPEDHRTIVRGAVGRIHDIADHLLEKYRAQPYGEEQSAAAHGTQDEVKEGIYSLASLIAPVITEKHFRYRSMPGVEIVAKLDSSSEGYLVRVEPAEFKRVLSNLIDNGVEALSGRGVVMVSLARDGDCIEVNVNDNGKGIPLELQERLGQKGQTFGKPGGFGLGLYYAKTCAESWGGQLKINSEIGEGTVITLRLPAASRPSPKPDAVLIDDDQMVHANWKVAARTNGKTFEAFSTPREFLAIVGRIDKKTPIYVDSKLADGIRGEEFAKELHARGFRNLYLATGHRRESLSPMPWIKEVVGKKAPWCAGSLGGTDGH